MILWIKILLLSGFLFPFCTTRVSEWVLLNNIPENYSLVYQYRGEKSAEAIGANRRLISEFTGANVQLRESVKDQITESRYILYHKRRELGTFHSADELTDLTRSPLRDKIAREIMSGKLCVMLLLRCGNAAKDNRSSDVIKDAISKSPFSSTITLVELERDNIAEARFTAMLLNVEEDLKTINEPMLFGIFGRFRALEPLVAGGISGENIGYMISFLTADCSCLIKDDLPGTDILYKGNWENPVPALVNRIIDENPSLQHK